MRKGFLFVSIVFITFVLFSCVRDDKFDEVYREVSIHFSPDDTQDHITNNVDLVRKSTINPRATITWTSSDENIISNTGVVNQRFFDMEVTLTAKITLGKKEKTKDFHLVVVGLYEATVLLRLPDEDLTLKTDEEGHLSLPNLDRIGYELVELRDLDTDEVVDIEQAIYEYRRIEVIYAVLKYRIDFNSNGGNEIASITNVEHSTTLSDLPIPIKKGFVFVGWIFENLAGYDQLLIGGYTPINQNIKAVAVWKQAN